MGWAPEERWPSKAAGEGGRLGQDCRPPPPGAVLLLNGALEASLSAHGVRTDHTREVSNRPTALFRKTSKQKEVPLCPYSVCPSDESCQEVLSL